MHRFFSGHRAARRKYTRNLSVAVRKPYGPVVAFDLRIEKLLHGRPLAFQLKLAGFCWNGVTEG